MSNDQLYSIDCDIMHATMLHVVIEIMKAQSSYISGAFLSFVN
jgi:hypothetical protein